MSAPRLILADDDTRSARRLATMLEEDGWLVEIYDDGAAAMARLSRPPPFDVIITDFVGAGVSGHTQHAEARRIAPRVPVVFVTNYPEHVARAPLDPPPVVIVKPVAYATLALELARILGRTSMIPS
jgi:two-component system cell cycle sensor histidine kinase/response regulator CckA